MCVCIRQTQTAQFLWQQIPGVIADRHEGRKPIRALDADGGSVVLTEQPLLAREALILW